MDFRAGISGPEQGGGGAGSMNAAGGGGCLRDVQIALLVLHAVHNFLADSLAISPDR